MSVHEVTEGDEVKALATGLARLRAEFPPETIGKLPKITCAACSKKECRDQAHNKKRCNECGGFMTPAHIHIDFVGHAPVTDRLLEVDPHWTWEPFAIGADGLPAVVKNERGVPVGMWIRLTVLGVTRPGYGSCEPKTEAVKELIGDAIRNAAMRFGVALDLWSKTDLESHRAEIETADYDTEDKPAAPAKRTGSEALARARAAVRPSAGAKPALPKPKDESSGAEKAPDATDGTDADTMTSAQNRMLHALLNGAGVVTDEERHEYATKVLERPVETYSGLTKADASKLIDSLKVGAS